MKVLDDDKHQFNMYRKDVETELHRVDKKERELEDERRKYQENKTALETQWVEA